MCDCRDCPLECGNHKPKEISFEAEISLLKKLGASDEVIQELEDMRGGIK